MNIARPIDGFVIVERPLILKTLAELTPTCPWLQRTYSDVKQKLRMAAHKVGSCIGDDLSNRVYIDADPDTGSNRLAVSYVVLGDTVTLVALFIIPQTARSD